MESKNEQSNLMGICHKFLNSFSRGSAFRWLHHIRNQSSHCDSKLMPVARCEGSTMVVATNAATCDGDLGNGIIVGQGIHMVSRNDLHSEMEDEPYLVSHEEASPAFHPVKEKSCDKDAALSDQMTLVSVGMANSATHIESHVEENGESHLKDEEAMTNSAIIEVQSKKSHLHTSSQPADTPNNQSENAGADSLTQLKNGPLREQSTLHDDKTDRGSGSGLTANVMEAKTREKGHVEATESKSMRDRKQPTAKSAKPPRQMRRPLGQNERPSVLIKRRKTTRRAGLAMDSVLP